MIGNYNRSCITNEVELGILGEGMIFGHEEL